MENNPTISTNPTLTDILNGASLFDGSLLQRILAYIEENDFDPQEIGDILEENDNLKDILYRDAVRHNEIVDTEMKIQQTQTDNEMW